MQVTGGGLLSDCEPKTVWGSKDNRREEKVVDLVEGSLGGV